MSLGLGSDMWVVLTGVEEIKHFSMMEEGVARPEMRTLNEMYSFGKALGTNCYIFLRAHSDYANQTFKSQLKYLSNPLSNSGNWS